MNKMLIRLAILVAFSCIILIVHPFLGAASASDDVGVCADLSGAAVGLCTAYYAMGCDWDNIAEEQCKKLISDFYRHTGGMTIHGGVECPAHVVSGVESWLNKVDNMDDVHVVSVDWREPVCVFDAYRMAGAFRTEGSASVLRDYAEGSPVRTVVLFAAGEASTSWDWKLLRSEALTAGEQAACAERFAPYISELTGYDCVVSPNVP